jgi:hypothetical protein
MFKYTNDLTNYLENSLFLGFCDDLVNKIDYKVEFFKLEKLKRCVSMERMKGTPERSSVCGAALFMKYFL